MQKLKVLKIEKSGRDATTRTTYISKFQPMADLDEHALPFFHESSMNYDRAFHTKGPPEPSGRPLCKIQKHIIKQLESKHIKAT